MKLPLSARSKDRFRPVYHALLDALSPTGNLVTMNGADTIRMIAALRVPPLGKHEPDVWHRLMDAVRPGDTCLDIGASIGLFTLGFANRLRGNGRVFSFEPDSSSYQILQRHISLNEFSGLVCPMNIAASDTNGVIQFMGGLGPTSHAAGPNDNTGDKTSYVSVAGVTLDTLFQGTGIVPDVIKIDVEGFELQVLKGAAGILGQTRKPRLIYLDMHPWAWPQLGLDTTTAALHELLRGFGYTIEKRNDEYEDIFAVDPASQVGK
jgi:FkbM family methyltransferase